MGSSLLIDVTLYGDLPPRAGGRYFARQKVELPLRGTMGDLYKHLKIEDNEKGYCFINAILCDTPGLSASHDEQLKDQDHVGIFSITYMWPYQYRDGVRMTDSLTSAMKTQGAMHNIYKKQD